MLHAPAISKVRDTFEMRCTRSISRPLVFLALLSLIVDADVAEASFLKDFRGAFKDTVDDIKELMSSVLGETKKKFSVLSKFFGDRITRGDLTLPQIFNNVFSRKNSIIVTNNSTNVKDWELGDGSSMIAALSTGGSITVSKNNGVVSIATGTGTGTKNGHSKVDKPYDDKSENEDKDKESRDGNNNTGNNDDGKYGDTEGPELRHGGSTTFSGLNLDNTFIGLLSDWDSFITSSIWDVQDENVPEPSSRKQRNENSLDSFSRVVNGVFLGNRIISGAPFAVKFFYNSEENFYCSGTLIGYAYALTAAHCGVVLGDDVRVGGHLLRSGYKATVSEIFIHPNFDPASLVHDIAIVRLDDLKDKLVLKKNGVKAARINRNDSFPDTGFVGVVSAHGSVETDGQEASEQLRSTRHSIHSMDKCKEEITQGDIEKEESYLCAGDGKRSTTCVGDSGAGLWHYRVKKTAKGKTRRFYEIFGVVSFGEVTDNALCPRGPPTVFQRTSTNYEWIQEVVGKRNMS